MRILSNINQSLLEINEFKKQKRLATHENTPENEPQGVTLLLTNANAVLEKANVVSKNMIVATENVDQMVQSPLSYLWNGGVSKQVQRPSQEVQRKSLDFNIS